MEIIGSLIPLLVVYPLFIILFHLGRYPSPLVSHGILRREGLEIMVIFAVVLIVRSLKPLYPFTSTLNWAVYAVGVYLGLSLLLLFIMEKVVRRRGLSTVGFRLPINRRVLILFTVILVLRLIGGIYLHLQLQIEFLFLGVSSISAILLGPFYEEAVFRGLIQTRLEAGLGTVRSWVLSGLMFGFYHYWAHFLIAGKMLTIPDLTQLVVITLFGMLLGVIFAKTRSLLPPFLLHAVNNFVAFG